MGDVRMIVVVMLVVRIYKKGSREEPVLASLSDSYSELEMISVSVSGPSSCPTSHFYQLF